MIGNVVVAAVVVMVTLGVGYADTPLKTPCNQAEVRDLMRSAHTAQQYSALASCFRARQEAFEQQAHAEKLEWERRSQNVSGPAAKYPRPVDSSKNRYEYFAYEAAKMDQQARHFESLATSAQ